MRPRHLLLIVLLSVLASCSSVESPVGPPAMSIGYRDYQTGKELPPQVEKDDTVMYLNDEYRTAGAPSAVLASFGRSPFSKTDSYERIGFFGDTDIETKIRGTITIANDAETRGKAQIDLKKIVQIEGGGELANSDKFKIVIHEISNLLEFEKAINSSIESDPIINRRIRDQYVRVITAMGVIYNHEAFEKVSSNADAKIAWKDYNYFELSGAGNISKKVNIGDGVIVAYQYSKLCWSKIGQVVATVRDRLGTNLCPDGTLDVHPDYLVGKQ